MHKLPLGRQDFPSLIKDGCLYVDKTEHIHRLIQGKYYFMSRPRRFGKSLLLSTIEELFLGNKETFKNLWIYDKYDWTKKKPVIKISFNVIPYRELGLRKALEFYMLDLAKKLNLEIETVSPSVIFKQLIEHLSQKNEDVVILIDEYDKPIIDYVDNIEQAEENRDILKSFYSILKDCDKFIRFLFITGVSKFSKVSIFSDLNNLEDISLSTQFSTILGITEDELEEYFSVYLKKLDEKYSPHIPDVIKRFKNEYFGYSWDGENFVYNPFTLLNIFKKNQFGAYWFRSGTPTFLMKLIKQQKYTSFDLENKIVFEDFFDKYEIDNISLISLLFQTGYLTIKKVNHFDMSLELDYPNNEVERSFTVHLLANMNGGKLDNANIMLYELMDNLRNHRIDKFMELLTELFKTIAYPLIDNKEKYYHSIFYLVVKMLGFSIESEIMTIVGRIDCVMKTKDIIYIIEFKTGNTKKAIEQIREKKYYEKYLSDKRQIKLFGIDFDAENKQIADWKLEIV